MTRLDINIFFAILECGSISGASKKLYISQSTLSARIKAMEEELNAPLFIRSKGIRHTEPTSFALSFIPIAEKWDRLWQETLDISVRASISQLNICASRSINVFIMPEICARFAFMHPELHVRLSTKRAAEAVQLIEDSRFDAAFISDIQFSHKCNITPLFRERMVCIHHIGNVADNEPVSVSQLDVSREISLDWNSDFINWRKEHFPAGNSPRVSTDNIDLVRRLLESAGFWSIVPNSVAVALTRDHSYIKSSPLMEPPPERTTYLLTRSTYAYSDELKAILNAIRLVIGEQDSEWLGEAFVNAAAMPESP